MNRKDEIGLSEILQRENIGYLTYSPLGFGTLTGKYLNGKADENSRINQFKQYTRYSSKQAFEATEKYFNIANNHNLSFAQMSLAFILQKKFVTAPIIGATTVERRYQEELRKEDKDAVKRAEAIRSECRVRGPDFRSCLA